MGNKTTKILICEDEPSHSRALAEKLAKQGFKLQVAPDGDACLLMAKSDHPDMIVLDLVLPRKDGFAVLKDIRNDHALKETAVVVVSNLSADADIKETLALGAKDYFVKSQHPINEIIQKIIDLLPEK